MASRKLRSIGIVSVVSVVLFAALLSPATSRRRDVQRCFGHAVNLAGGSGDDDVLIGRTGRDVIHGRRGADSAFGLSGSDRLCGGRGNDRLNGGDGFDRIDGGAGYDVCQEGERVIRCEQFTRTATLPLEVEPTAFP